MSVEISWGLKLVLKKLILHNKPDFCFIAEPWTAYDVFLYRWFDSLGLKLLAKNDRASLLPNLWCFCKKDLNPQLIQSSDQMVFLLPNSTNPTIIPKQSICPISHLPRSHLLKQSPSLLPPPSLIFTISLHHMEQLRLPSFNLPCTAPYCANNTLYKRLPLSTNNLQHHLPNKTIFKFP